MTIEPDGDVSIEAGNLVLASGQGIDFSAFSNDSEMTSELFDDYEEGLVTMGTNVGAGSLSLSASNDHLAYTKIGRVVYISGAIQMASESGTSGNYIQFTNLPYAATDLDEVMFLAFGDPKRFMNRRSMLWVTWVFQPEVDTAKLSGPY